ncbi:hypothetical protein OS493_024780 [Desmophyllum pertusum]|uniref:deoxyhypusine synthase n=1 Tax=Desmophyllum pertusum TaxID=174260 RepID=A0A9W9ZB54_9CNID|nr:hypothetical protein OS493_024780 [Desmophyllum pertusum]
MLEKRGKDGGRPSVSEGCNSSNKRTDAPGSEEVRGYDFSNGVDYHALLKSYRTTGFQAGNFGKAVEEINKMIKKKSEPLPEPEDGAVDCIVTTAGGIEEDLMKCMAPSYLGDFSLRGDELRKKGINRIGNLLVPNNNYCSLEEWILPVWDKMLEEQKSQGIHWTPSQVISRLGKEINHPDSVCYWAYKNNIPVFSPALTDGALGDTLYFHSFKNPGLAIDIVADIRKINSISVYAKNTGMIIIGGGLMKHHICNANLMRNGADFSVFVNTGQEFDGSDSGARPDEAVSWGKIKMTASPVKVYADASLVFPLLVAETFARNFKINS